MYKRKFGEVDTNNTSIEELVLKYNLFTKDSIKQIANTRIQRFITTNFTKDEISKAIENYKPPTNSTPNRYLMLKNFISDDMHEGHHKSVYLNQPWEFMLPGLIQLFKIVYENKLDVYKLESVCNDTHWRLNFTGSPDKYVIAKLISGVNNNNEIMFDKENPGDDVVTFDFPVSSKNKMTENIIEVLNKTINLDTAPITPIHYLFLLTWANMDNYVFDHECISDEYRYADNFNNACSADMCQDFFNHYYDKLEALIQNPTCDQFADFRKLDRIFRINTKKCTLPDFASPMVRNFSMDMLVENCIYCNDNPCTVCLYCYGGNIAKLHEFDWTLFDILWQNEDEYKKDKTVTMRSYQLFLQTIDEAIYDTLTNSKITNKFLKKHFDCIVANTNDDNKKMSEYLTKILKRHYEDLNDDGY